MIDRAATIKNITLGGFQFPFDPQNDANDLILTMESDGGAANLNSTCRKLGASSGYQVPSGKTLYVLGFVITATAAGIPFVPAQSDNDVGIQSSTALSNPVYMLGGTTSVRLFSSETAYKRTEYGIAGAWSVASLKYLSIQESSASGQGQVLVYCKLVG